MNEIQAQDRSPAGPLRSFFRRLEMAFFRSKASWFFAMLMSRKARHLYEQAGSELGPLPPGTRLADIGCGHGTLLTMYLSRTPGVKGFGLDQSAELIRFAENQSKEAGVDAEYMVGDVHTATLPKNAFDAMVSTSSIYCWHDPVVALNNLYESLKPGARFLLWEVLPVNSFADAKCALLDQKVFGLSIPAYTETELREFVAQSRFDKVNVTVDRLIIRFEMFKATEKSESP